MVEWDESEEKACESRYFEAVLRMFEQLPAREYIIKTAEAALLILGDDHPKSVSTVDFPCVQTFRFCSWEIYGLYVQSISMYTYGTHKP